MNYMWDLTPSLIGKVAFLYKEHGEWMGDFSPMYLVQTYFEPDN